jgi:hypothetical protein
MTKIAPPTLRISGNHRAGIVEQLEIGVGDDVGRDRERKQQQPLQQVTPGEAIHGHEPCRPGADEERQGADAGKQKRGAAKRSRQHVFDQMRPGIAARLKRDRGEGEQGQNDNQRNEQRRQRPGEIAALLQPRQPAAKRTPLR